MAEAVGARGAAAGQVSPARAAFGAELCFFAFIAVCIWIDPRGWSANVGISYYGVEARTLLPYCLALTGGGWLLVRASRALPYDGLPGTVRRTLPVLAGLLVGLEVTPFALNAVFNWTHMTLGASLFLAQLGLAIRIARGAGWVGWLLVTVQTAGGLVSAYSLPRATGHLLQGQLMFQLAFAVLLVRTVRGVRAVVPADAVPCRAREAT